MQVKTDGSRRSYRSEKMLQDVVARRLGENEKRIPWVAMQLPDGRWTAIIFLPHEFEHMAFNIASFGFMVYN